MMPSSSPKGAGTHDSPGPVRPLRLDWREPEVIRVVFPRVSEFAGRGPETSCPSKPPQSPFAGGRARSLGRRRPRVSTATPYLVRRPESDIPCTPPTDSTGFIYCSYRAAATEAHRARPSPKSSHRGVAHVSSALGGSVPTISFEDTAGSRLVSRTRRGGSIRDRARGFSLGRAAGTCSGAPRASTGAPSGPSRGASSS